MSQVCQTRTLKTPIFATRCTVEGFIPQGESWKKQREQAIEAVKQQVKFDVNYEDEKALNEHVKSLTKQGKLLELARVEQIDLTWKSYIFNTKKNTLKFILNSSLDTCPIYNGENVQLINVLFVRGVRHYVTYLIPVL